MKNLKVFFSSLVLFLAISLTSCSDDDNVKGGHTFEEYGVSLMNVGSVKADLYENGELILSNITLTFDYDSHYLSSSSDNLYPAIFIIGSYFEMEVLDGEIYGTINPLEVYMTSSIDNGKGYFKSENDFYFITENDFEIGDDNFRYILLEVYPVGVNIK